MITDIASSRWLLNIRSKNVPFMPCIPCYLIVDKSGKVLLFTDNYYNDNVEKYFRNNNVAVYDLAELPNQLKKYDTKPVQISIQASHWLWQLLKNPIAGEDPCLLTKACKNKTELIGAQTACLLDSKAIMKCLNWTKTAKVQITELDISNKILEFQRQEKTFVSSSFPSIVAFKENASLVHYRPTEIANKCVQGNGLLLIDAGGQYLSGTTDTTRTIALGQPTKEQIHNFTLVLKGHLNLIMAVFPEGTSGEQLDSLARMYLWHEGKDYDHGTGHGVGSFLSVHEGPQNIAKHASAPLCANMIVSIEPGFYKPGEYGIRIENLAYVKKHKTPGYLSFEVLTFIIIDENLIDFTMLTDQEIQWVRSYNKRCHEVFKSN